MSPIAFQVKRRALAVQRLAREVRMIARGLLSTKHAVLAHLIPIRRCNLACAYCNEYDDHSLGVPLPKLLNRVDRLADLGVNVITISGGEPLLHPELDQLITHIRHRGLIAGLITNGFLLNEKRIWRLNDSGLDHLQISIDNVEPDEVSKKSLKTLDVRLKMLAENALFHVNINSVVGGGIKDPEDALTIGRRAVELGLTSTVGIIHDGDGQLKPLAARERAVYRAMRAMEKSSYSRFNQFQEAIADGRPNKWRCRAGSRYLYICEDGLVHYCSQQRGFPGVRIEEYTRADLRREFLTEKTCAPTCTVSCVHQVSMIDFWRAPQTLSPRQAPEGLVQID